MEQQFATKAFTYKRAPLWPRDPILLYLRFKRWGRPWSLAFQLLYSAVISLWQTNGEALGGAQHILHCLRPWKSNISLTWHECIFSSEDVDDACDWNSKWNVLFRFGVLGCLRHPLQTSGAILNLSLFVFSIPINIFVVGVECPRTAWLQLPAGHDYKASTSYPSDQRSKCHH